jgi:NADH:ubiquinone oxidoreductase subunit 5 (subunit L)/multisubunit Na+/H+ antiporter MnhA subunit
MDHFIHFIYNKNMDENTENDAQNNLQDINNSPLQLIDQLKGYYYINPILSLSLAITLFSFVGIPPLIGFFAKQMVLSAAIDSGYVFMSLVAIFTSVISAVYYLAIIKQIFFDTPDNYFYPKLGELEKSIENIYLKLKTVNYKNETIKQNETIKHETMQNNDLASLLKPRYLKNVEDFFAESPKDFSRFLSNLAEYVINMESKQYTIRKQDVFMSSSLSLPISILTLIIGLFIFTPAE